MQDLKERVDEVSRILNYERSDIQHAHDLAKIVYNKQDIQYIKELIKDQQSRIEELETENKRYQKKKDDEQRVRECLWRDKTQTQEILTKRIEELETEKKGLITALEWYASIEKDGIPVNEGEDINDDLDIGRTARQALNIKDNK